MPRNQNRTVEDQDEKKGRLDYTLHPSSMAQFGEHSVYAYSPLGTIRVPPPPPISPTTFTRQLQPNPPINHYSHSGFLTPSRATFVATPFERRLSSPDQLITPNLLDSLPSYDEAILPSSHMTTTRSHTTRKIYRNGGPPVELDRHCKNNADFLRESVAETRWVIEMAGKQFDAEWEEDQKEFQYVVNGLKNWVDSLKTRSSHRSRLSTATPTAPSPR